MVRVKGVPYFVDKRCLDILSDIYRGFTLAVKVFSKQLPRGLKTTTVCGLSVIIPIECAMGIYLIMVEFGLQALGVYNVIFTTSMKRSISKGIIFR